MKQAATFGWLCVETTQINAFLQQKNAATFGWLCVETAVGRQGLMHLPGQPPSGGCVLKQTR